MWVYNRSKLGITRLVYATTKKAVKLRNPTRLRLRSRQLAALIRRNGLVIHVVCDSGRQNTLDQLMQLHIRLHFGRNVRPKIFERHLPVTKQRELFDLRLAQIHDSLPMRTQVRFIQDAHGSPSPSFQAIYLSTKIGEFLCRIMRLVSIRTTLTSPSITNRVHVRRLSLIRQGA